MEKIKINGKVWFIIYSPDDGGYYTDNEKGQTSQVFNTKEKLLTAIKNNSLKWK